MKAPMQAIDAPTTREMFTLADELYEVMQLNILKAAYEVVQVRHDDLTQFVVTEYHINPDDNMSQVSHALNNIKSSVIFPDCEAARAHVMQIVFQANLSA
jgi:hypothetical protein